MPPASRPGKAASSSGPGETLTLGPITLGQPDARLTMRSQPSGAEVSVGGTFRGRTPLVVELPSGMSHEIVATLPGYAAWNRSVRAEPGKSVALDARLRAGRGARDGAGRARRCRSLRRWHAARADAEVAGSHRHRASHRGAQGGLRHLRDDRHAGQGPRAGGRIPADLRGSRDGTARIRADHQDEGRLRAQAGSRRHVH